MFPSSRLVRGASVLLYDDVPIDNYSKIYDRRMIRVLVQFRMIVPDRVDMLYTNRILIKTIPVLSPG